jgi:uncharacterized protein (TIGR03435 family)
MCVALVGEGTGPWITRALAQTSAPDPPNSSQFDVAVVKPNNDGDYRVYVGDNAGGRFSATGITLRLLIRYAYDVQDVQIVGGPKWLASDRWNVEAKAEGVSGRLTSEQQMRMMRSLLAERFRLKVHPEQKKLVPAYALVVVNAGRKLRPNTSEPGPDVRLGRGHMTFRKVRLSALASQLTRQLGRQVLDQTNLNGEFDFVLDWVPDPSENGAIPGQPGPGPDSIPGGEETGPSIFTALKEQLGLRLARIKAPLDVLVIDRAEKPSAN